MRLCGCVVWAWLVWAGGVCAWAAEPAAMPEAVPDDLQATVREVLWKLQSEGAEENELLERMRIAGASFNAELAADAAKSDTYLEEETQRMMVGVYLMDMSYATVFGKHQESLEFAAATEALSAKLGFSSPKIMAQYRAALETVEQETIRNQLRNLENTIETSWNDYMDKPQGLDFAVDATCGWMIEGLYLVMELAAQTDYDLAFVRFIEEQRVSIRLTVELLSLFTEHPGLAEMVERDERLQLFDSILAVMKNMDTEKIDREQLDFLRRLVVDTRAKIVQ